MGTGQESPYARHHTTLRVTTTNTYCFPYCDMVWEQLQLWLPGGYEDSRVEEAERNDGNEKHLTMFGKRPPTVVLRPSAWAPV